MRSMAVEKDSVRPTRDA
uniref:Uncharacterized protein n=1 Tax=Arundo donax TaxID=35708 RepID=A0A0A9HHM5_ARUDO